MRGPQIEVMLRKPGIIAQNRRQGLISDTNLYYVKSYNVKWQDAKL